MTKHGFLDKIKSTAATIIATKRKPDDDNRSGPTPTNKASGKWDALKDDFMMKPKKVRSTSPVVSFCSCVFNR